ncbi:hypothetical protein FHG87_008648 [Trinorchestia longiramus]|nr:hypothetical protein FHG87_008648 [Trinorchestia longiramus]
MEECRFCYSNNESAETIENQSRKTQELSRQLEFNRQIKLLVGRLVTIETNQKQNYEHEPRFQSSETHLDHHLPTNNQPPYIKIIAKRSNFYLKTKNRFNALKDEMENNINCTKEQTTQISKEHNPQRTQSHTQPAGILEPIRKLNKITNINLQNFDGNKRTTNKKPRTRKNLLCFSLETASSKDRKLSLSRG